MYPQQQAPKVSRLSVAGWVLYDLANTIFSINVISLYFSLWVVNVMGGTDQQYGNASGLAMALILVTAPVIGALSDQSPRRLPFLMVTTLLCVGFTMFLGLGGLAASLAIFVVAVYFHEAGIIFYDSLLAEVSTEENRGRVGGLGIGIGYVGSLIGIGTGLLVLHLRPGDYGLLFRITAVLFLLFSVPAFVFVRERRRLVPRFGLGAVPRAFGQIRQTAARARRYPNLTRFLVGRVFYTDGANTLTVFMGIYVTNEIGFSQRDAQLVLLVGIVAAIIGGICWGFVVDRVGPKRTLNVVLCLWMALFLLAAGIPVLGLPSGLFWLVAALGGIALGGTWSADRPYMLILSPPRYLGQFYGLYSMVGRFSAVIGPVLWGLIVNTLGWGRPAAILGLLVMVLVAFFILQPVSDARQTWSPAELAQA